MLPSVQVVNRVCYALSIISIVAATGLSIAIIWASQSRDTFCRALATVAVVFVASLITMAVNNSLADFATSDGRARRLPPDRPGPGR